MNTAEIIAIIRAIETLTKVSSELYRVYQESKMIDPSSINLDHELELQRTIKEMAELRITLYEKQETINSMFKK